MNSLNQWLGPDVRLKGMNALKWATGCADGVENPLGNLNVCCLGNPEGEKNC